MTQNWNHQEENEKKKKQWISKIPTVTKCGGTISCFCNGDRNPRLRALLQKPWQLLVQSLRRQRILHLSDPSVYTKCQTVLLFKTIKRATHKERERERERGIPEPWEKRVVARVGFDVWDQGGEEIGVVVVVGFGHAFWVLLWSRVEDGSGGGGGFWTLEPMANLNLCSGNSVGFPWGCVVCITRTGN